MNSNTLLGFVILSTILPKSFIIDVFTKARCAMEMKIQMKSLSKFEAFIMKKQQNQDSIYIVAKVIKDITSTIYYVILIGQLCK